MLDLGLDGRRCSGSEAIELIMAAAFGWLFGVEPHRVIDQDGEFARVPAKLQAEPRMFEAHIKRHLLDNPHRYSMLGGQ
jgi:Zn-dependent M16 (insulinase) family peptidase